MLPDGEDIDSLLQGQGLESFEALRGFAPDGLDFCIRALSSRPPREALDWVKDFLAAVERPELLSRFVTRFAQTLNLDEAELRRGLRLSPHRKDGQAGARDRGTETIPALEKDVLDKRIMQFVARCPHYLPALRDSGARLLLARDWALSLWEKEASCGPDYDPDSIALLLDDAERDFWWRYRVLEAPPIEHQEQELADLQTIAAQRGGTRQADACVQALRQNADKSEIDADLLRSLFEAAKAARREAQKRL
jgi:DNA primase